MEELKLYCPLTGELFEQETEADWYEDVSEEALHLDGSDLSAFSDLIRQALDREMDFPEATPRGLMEYYHEEDGVDKKVRSMTVKAEEINGVLYGVGVCQVDGQLTQDEMIALKDYFSGQMSDGFGEGFEQRPLQTSFGELYVHLWQSDDRYFVRTQQEMVQAAQRVKPRTPQRGGDAR